VSWANESAVPIAKPFSTFHRHHTLSEKTDNLEAEGQPRAFGKSRKEVECLGRKKPMNERIVIDPEICHGKPVIRGTRTPVTVILDALAGGDSFETLQKEYDITEEDIRACIAFAAEEIGQIAYLPAS
jgi:uncharacterized protein (DUF433 family)